MPQTKKLKANTSKRHKTRKSSDSSSPKQKSPKRKRSPSTRSQSPKREKRMLHHHRNAMHLHDTLIKNDSEYRNMVKEFEEQKKSFVNRDIDDEEYYLYALPSQNKADVIRHIKNLREEDFDKFYSKTHPMYLKWDEYLDGEI